MFSHIKTYSTRVDSVGESLLTLFLLVKGSFGGEKNINGTAGNSEIFVTNFSYSYFSRALANNPICYGIARKPWLTQQSWTDTKATMHP